MDPRLDGQTLKTSLSALLDLVLPRVCVVCGRPLLPQEEHLCLGCLADLPETRYATLGHNPMADRFNARIQVDEFEPYAYAAALYQWTVPSRKPRESARLAAMTSEGRVSEGAPPFQLATRPPASCRISIAAA